MERVTSHEQARSAGGQTRRSKEKMMANFDGWTMEQVKAYLLQEKQDEVLEWAIQDIDEGIRLQEMYPRERMQEIVRENPHPTYVEALERGMAWSDESIIGSEAKEGMIFCIAEDGKIACSPLGAIYIGCVGYRRPEELPVDARLTLGRRDVPEHNASADLVLRVVRNTVRNGRQASGAIRSEAIVKRHQGLLGQYVVSLETTTAAQDGAYVRIRGIMKEAVRELDDSLARKVAEEARFPERVRRYRWKNI
jgi:hypothetical protein